MKRMNLRTLLAAFALGLVQMASAQVVKNERLLSFEEGVPAEMTAVRSQLSINDEHYKDGTQSLAWKFQPKGVISLKRDLKFEPFDKTGVDQYMSCFVVWVYNEKAQDKEIRFNFLKNGEICTSFPFRINYTGWRAAWVCYERDMEGTPKEGMNEMQIIAPDTEGELFIDHLITAVKLDARQQAADYQVPFVHKETTNHWLVVYKHSMLTTDLPLQPVTDSEKKAFEQIEDRYISMLYTPGKVSTKEVEKIRKNYDAYGITYKNNKVSGMPIFLCRQAEAYERMLPNWDKDMFEKLGMEMRNYFDLMRDIAVVYRKTKDEALKDEMAKKFMAMYDHITDQGVIYGSCWGNIHHYGYSTRGLFISYFLMKDVLRQQGKLDEAVKTLQWYAITNEIYPKPLVDGVDIDTFNTKLPGRMMSILIMEDTPEKARYLRAFSRWLDHGCRPSLGLGGSFKKDGGAFHHRNNYPAYAVGGLDGATTMIYLLSGTNFAVSELAHSTVNNVLLTMRFYCNTYQWPLSMSGRHPNGKGQLIPSEYGLMAISGTADGKQKYDPVMAGAFLRLVDREQSADKNAPDYLPQTNTTLVKRIKKILLNEGFKPEADPQGNKALGYGCTSIQRRDNWSAVVRGHSRYLWNAEHYLPANFYGRYLGYGSLQIQNARPEQNVTFKTSGWQEKGFDWNRIPGTTSIHLPFEKLRAVVLNVDKYSGMEEMLYSDEAFAGPLSQERTNGNFGMVLHEHDKYNGSHRARLSYHFFDNRIVALGSDIENDVKEYPTETTIFQLAAINGETKAYWEGWKDNGHTYVDPNGVGYYVPGKARFIKAFPQTTVGERSPKPTKGDWVSLIVEHGNAPKGAAYEYAIQIGTDAKAMKAMAKKPGYKVLKQDRNGHIVWSEDLKTTSYVLFEKNEGKLPGQWIEEADTSCLAMVKEVDKKNLVLTVAQPDLAFYRGPSDEAFDENGKRIERSIYSRPWIDNDSQEIPVTITLKGKWNLKETENVKVLSADKRQTVIRFICKDGFSYDVKLKR